MSDLSKIVNNDAEEIPEENSDSVAVPDAFQGDGKEREAKTAGVRTSCMNEFESEEQYSKNLDGEGQTRRDFVVMSALAVGCAGAAAAAVPFIRSMSPDAGVLAVGSTEVDISHMISGEIITVMWRGVRTRII